MWSEYAIVNNNLLSNEDSNFAKMYLDMID